MTNTALKLFFGSFLIASAATSATQPAELLSGGSWDRNAFTYARFWAEYGTTTPLGTESDPLPTDRDYLVRSGRGFLTPTGASVPIVFSGHSLTLGDADTKGTIYISSYDNGILRFPDPGVTIVNGAINVRTGYNHPSYFEGTLTIASQTTDQGVFTSTYSNNVLHVRSLVHFASDAQAKITCGSAANVPFVCEFTNESSDFDGSLLVSSAGAGVIGGDPVTTLGLCSLSPNSLELEANARLRPVDADDVISVKTLTLADGAQLEVKAKYTGTTPAEFKATNSVIAVSEALNLPEEGKVYLKLPRLLNKLDGQTDSVAILKAPAGSIDPEKFEILPVADGAFYDYTLTASPEGDVLYVKTVPAVMLLTSDEGGTASGGTSAFVSGDRWSNGAAPTPGVHYLVWRNGGSNKIIRSSGKVFAGSSLTIDNCSLYIFQHETTQFDVLRLLDGANMWQYGGSWCNLTANRIEVPSGTVKFCYNAGRSLRFNGPLVGAATLWFAGVEGTSGPSGDYQLYKNSPDFTGRIRASVQSMYKIAGPFDSAHQVCKAYLAGAIGGPLETFDPKAFELGNYDELLLVYDLMGKVTNMAFTDTTRGFYFDKAVSLTVPAGKTGTFMAQRTFNGELFLCGDGTKALGGSVKFANGDAIVDTPVEGANSNRLTVVAGDVKALSSTCLDGLVVTFSNATSRIVIDADTADAALASNGVVNVKTDVPFVLKGDTLNFHLTRQGTSPLDRKVAHKIGLVTVAPEAAKRLRDHISVTIEDGVIGRCQRQIEERTDPETGNVTFYESLGPGGILLIVR